jgi:DNA-binding response OmpR family regulator
MKILVVDDEKPIVEAVSFSLRREGFDTVSASNAEDCIRAFKDERPDLVILDVMLPSASGFEVCRVLRKEHDVPIIMLTARTGEVDRVAGLELGADDYVTKPFSLRELVARVKAILRRKDQPRRGSKIQVAGLVVEKDRHEVTVRGKKVEFTRREFALLEMLASNPDRVFSRETLLDRLWGSDAFVEARTIDVHMRWLREKIEENPGKPKILLTVRGVGYKLSSAP